MLLKVKGINHCLAFLWQVNCLVFVKYTFVFPSSLLSHTFVQRATLLYEPTTQTPKDKHGFDGNIVTYLNFASFEYTKNI